MTAQRSLRYLVAHDHLPLLYLLLLSISDTLHDCHRIRIALDFLCIPCSLLAASYCALHSLHLCAGYGIDVFADWHGLEGLGLLFTVCFWILGRLFYLWEPCVIQHGDLFRLYISRLTDLSVCGLDL
jgi:hypothetical protein